MFPPLTPMAEKPASLIEHTPAPYEAVKQMSGVLKPGGLLSISTPNIVWQPVVQTATRMKLRMVRSHHEYMTAPRLAFETM